MAVLPDDAAAALEGFEFGACALVSVCGMTGVVMCGSRSDR
jgi:hypothetical protein